MEISVEMKTVNFELNYPTLEEARQLLARELDSARQKKIAILKIIHGYGSSGVGGALRTGLRSSLSKRRKEKLIQHVIYGENWSVFQSTARDLLDRFPALRRDSDLERCNPGISIVIL